MPDQRQGGRQRGGQQRAVVNAQPSSSGQGEGAQRALVAVAHEIDNRMAIARVSVAAGINPERLKQVALAAFTRTPALWTCDPITVARSIVEAGQLGLEPTGLLGGAYLVPRGAQCTLLVGYRGLVMLAMRSGLVQRVEARVVREKDAFDYAYGLEPRLEHVPSQAADPGPYTGAYAVIFYRDGSRQFDYMSMAEINAIRARSSAGQAGPWVTDTAEMMKKTPLRRLMKLAPLTVEVATLLDELDPEVTEGTAVRVSESNARQQALRAELQEALEREHGGQQPPTTQAGAVSADEGQADSKGDPAPHELAQAQATQPAPQAQSAPQAAPAEQAPEAVVATEVCGARSESLGAGPCVLPPGHQREQFTVGSTTYPPQQEHQEAGGALWTQPR